MKGLGIKTESELVAMRRAGQIVGSLLFELEKRVVKGVTPKELDQFASQFISEKGGLLAFKGYQGYPATLCISVNDAVVHGIPDDRPLQEGDLVGIDAGAIVDGFYADAAITVGITPSPEALHLLSVTQEALKVGIERLIPGQHLGDAQAAIQRVIETAGMGIIYQLTGHGIGRALHEAPEIANFGQAGTGPLLKAGMTLCLEPMVTLGAPDIAVAPDGWTVRTQDHSLGAHFEHTILITHDQPEILTLIRPWPHA